MSGTKIIFKFSFSQLFREQMTLNFRKLSNESVSTKKIYIFVNVFIINDCSNKWSCHLMTKSCNNYNLNMRYFM